MDFDLIYCLLGGALIGAAAALLLGPRRAGPPARKAVDTV